MSDQSNADHRAELLEAFRIEMDDLVANRSGKLSERQGQLLIRGGYFGFFAAGIICVALGSVLAFVSERPLQPVQWIVSGLLGLAMIIAAVVYFRGSQKATNRGVVECLVGPVQVGRRGRSGFYLTMGKRSFGLPVKPRHVRNEATYRIYVTPGTDRLVAMEPIE